jgi:uncharacterized membrane protein YccC
MRGPTKYIINLLIAAGVVCYIYIWLILKVTGVLKTFVDVMERMLPAWFPIFNLVALPVLVAVLGLRMIRPLWAILVVGVATLFCYNLIGLSYHRYRVATIIVHLLVLAEMFWIIPKWRKSRGKDRSADHD